jgi:hypothetical protein
MEIVFQNQRYVIKMDNNAFVYAKEGCEIDCPDAEIAVQEWIDSEEGQDSIYATATAGRSYEYNGEDGSGIQVQLNW